MPKPMNKANYTMPYLSEKSTRGATKLLLLCGLLLSVAFTAGCQTTAHRADSTAHRAGAKEPVAVAGAYRIGPVSGSPDYDVFGAGVDVAAGTSAMLMDVLRDKGLTIVADNAAARYEVSAAWKTDGDVVVDDSPQQVLEVTVVDLHSGNVVYNRASRAVNVQVLGPQELRAVVVNALSGLRR